MIRRFLAYLRARIRARLNRSFILSFLMTSGEWPPKRDTRDIDPPGA